MIIIKNSEDIAKMRVAGRSARAICEALAARVSPGITTETRDRRSSAHFKHTVVVGETVADVLTECVEKKCLTMKPAA